MEHLQEYISTLNKHKDIVLKYAFGVSSLSAEFKSFYDQYSLSDIFSTIIEEKPIEHENRIANQFNENDDATNVWNQNTHPYNRLLTFNCLSMSWESVDFKTAVNSIPINQVANEKLKTKSYIYDICTNTLYERVADIHYQTEDIACKSLPSDHYVATILSNDNHNINKVRIVQRFNFAYALLITNDNQIQYFWLICDENDYDKPLSEIRTFNVYNYNYDKNQWLHKLPSTTNTS